MKKILIATFFLVALTAKADTVTVTNTVKTSASSGSNTSSGTQVEGESKASVQVKTVVNGQVIEDYSETKTSSGGEPAIIRFESSYSTSTPKSKIGTHIETEAVAEPTYKTGRSELILKVHGDGPSLIKTTELETNSTSTSSERTTIRPSRNYISSIFTKIIRYVFNLFSF